MCSFVEERKRGRGIAGVVPDFVRKDLASLRISQAPDIRAGSA